MSNRDKREHQQPRGPRARRAADHSPRPRTPKLVQPCAYCGVRPHTTRDHVFAKGLFDRLPVENLTVPTCRECNQGSGDGVARPMNHDEEYFRTVVVMRQGAERHPVAQRVFQTKVLRAIDNSPGMFMSIAAKMRMTTSQNEFGILIPNTPTCDIEHHRLRRVLRKQAKGLFYRYMKRSCPMSAVITTIPVINRQMFDALNLVIPRLPFFVEPTSLDEDAVVVFTGGAESTETDNTIWLVNWYKSFTSALFTMSPDTAVKWRWSGDVPQ